MRGGHRLARMQEMPGFDNPFFRRFFGEEFEQRQPRRQQNAPRQLGQGSGVIVTKDGYVLTNNHVVDEADEVKVVLLDGREFIGKVVGKDPKTDVAVLKIDGKDLPFIEMADSDKIEVGDMLPSAHYETLLKRVPPIWDKAFEVNAADNAAVRASCVEFILAGLYATDRISRAQRHGVVTYEVG